MKYMTGNIMNYIGRPDAICITTNGFITSSGAGVMGMGIAKSMSDKYPELKSRLGTHLKSQGNVVGGLMAIGKTSILAMPVKPRSIILENYADIVSHAKDKYVIGSMVPGFHCVADVSIIERSCKELVEYANAREFKTVMLPIPGCGAGELSYNFNGIRAICESILDDRFWMCSFKPQDFGR